MSIKPMILTNDDFAEGVYAAASGSQESSKTCNITSTTGCWTGTATLNQYPELGQDCYTVHFDAHHAQVDHLEKHTRIVATFNQNVTLGREWTDVESCTVNGSVVTAIRRCAANGGESFGATGMYIFAKPDIGIISVVMDENY